MDFGASTIIDRLGLFSLAGFLTYILAILKIREYMSRGPDVDFTVLQVNHYTHDDKTTFDITLEIVNRGNKLTEVKRILMKASPKNCKHINIMCVVPTIYEDSRIKLLPGERDVRNEHIVKGGIIEDDVLEIVITLIDTEDNSISKKSTSLKGDPGHNRPAIFESFHGHYEKAKHFKKIGLKDNIKTYKK